MDGDGRHRKEAVRVFGVEQVVPKWAGPKELEAALRVFTQQRDSAQA
jgi:hypothetical protein